ncbi:MAG TPA: PGPGW domain-containing protein [Actinomycetota bacterium]|nr:PGPGW domain-containing protein [Actinomycetota bacterium]
MTDLNTTLHWAGRGGKRVAVTLVGLALVAAGVVLLVIPGPGMLVVGAGLAVLATEYTWARRALKEARRRARSASNRIAHARRSRGASVDWDQSRDRDPTRST